VAPQHIRVVQPGRFCPPCLTFGFVVEIKELIRAVDNRSDEKPIPPTHVAEV
jgi:hypothetical protein